MPDETLPESPPRRDEAGAWGGGWLGASLSGILSHLSPLRQRSTGEAESPPQQVAVSPLLGAPATTDDSREHSAPPPPQLSLASASPLEPAAWSFGSFPDDVPPLPLLPFLGAAATASDSRQQPPPPPPQPSSVPASAPELAARSFSDDVASLPVLDVATASDSSQQPPPPQLFSASTSPPEPAASHSRFVALPESTPAVASLPTFHERTNSHQHLDVAPTGGLRGPSPAASGMPLQSSSRPHPQEARLPAHSMMHVRRVHSG